MLMMSQTALKGTSNGKHILVVEDSLDFQFLLKYLLENEGYRVSCSSNGDEALQYLKSQQDLPHLILLDLMMPIMDGVEFRKQQQLQPRLTNIPVVLLTAHGDAQTSRSKVSAKAYLRKPVELTDLLDVVKKNCD